MNTDIFSRIKKNTGPLGQWQEATKGTLSFPKMEGAVASKINFNDREMITWSYNNYLGLANSEVIKSVDAEAFAKYPWSCTMGSRMMTGNSQLHEEFESKFATMVKKEAALLLNIGYQGMLSIIQALVSKNDIIIADQHSHACVMDALKMHKGIHYTYTHNDMNDLEGCLAKAAQTLKGTDGGILVITEGVFSMNGHQGELQSIVALKKKYPFRILLDDAHGFGVMGTHGAGTHVHQDVNNEIDLYFTTFTKSMVSIGAAVAGDADIINYLLYNTRSQIFSKSLPAPIVYGLIERLKTIQLADDRRSHLSYITSLLQIALADRNLIDPNVNSCITPVVLQMTASDAFEMLKLMREDFKIFCSVVLYPVVPKGTVLIRMIPTADHTDDDVMKTMHAMDNLIPQFTKIHAVYA